MFQEHYRTRHAALVSRLSGVVRYTQSHTLLSGYRKREPLYDGVDEVWVKNTDVLRSHVDTAELAAINANAAEFIHLPSVGTIIVDDHLIKGGAVPEGALKNMEFVRHRADLSIPAFQKHWREIHGPMAAAIPVIERYVQSHVRGSAYDSGISPAYDGVAITWFRNIGEMRVSAESPEYRSIREDELNFLSPGTLPFIITREESIISKA